MRKAAKSSFIGFLFVWMSSVLIGCVTVPEGVGDGSESGYVMEKAMLPDGREVDMHLFKTAQEMNAYFQEIANGKWYMKHYYDVYETMFLSSNRNYQIAADDIFIKPYTVDELGEIGQTMFNKGLPIATFVERIGSEVRQISISLYDDWRTARYSVIDYIDEISYKSREASIAAEKKKQEAEREKQSREASNSSPSYFSNLFEAQKKKDETASSQNSSNGVYPQTSTQQQNNSSNNTKNERNNDSYHTKNRADLNNYLRSFLVDRIGGAAALERCTEDELRRYEELLEKGYSGYDAARILYNEFRK